MNLPLPSGRRGQILALSLTMAMIAAVLAAALPPALSLYDERANRIADGLQTIAHMRAIAAELPTLREAAEQAATAPPPPAALIDGETDAVATAKLQESVQALAASAGCSLASQETLPAEAVDHYRRVALHVSLSAPYPALVTLIRSIEGATPRLFVDDLRLQGPLLATNQSGVPLDASFTVIGFSAAGGAAR